MTESNKTSEPSQEVTKCCYRPPRRYCFPDIESLCRLFGVKPTGGDVIQSADVGSVKAYRQALQRTFIQRRPGEYFMEGLAKRLNLSARTIQRYHHALKISCEPTFEDHPVNRQNFRDLLMTCADYKRYHISVWGHFLEDETGKRYPPYREIAGKLLKQKHVVFYRKQRANRYWIGENPPASPEAKSHPAISRKPAEAGSNLKHPLASLPDQNIALAHVNPALKMGMMHHAPTESGRQALQAGRAAGSPLQNDVKNTEDTAHLAPKTRESKRKYRQEMADSAVEGLAQSVYKVVRELAPSEQAMSIANARRLVEIYGTKPVAHTLNKLIWMAGKGKIQNPAGFMITVSRQQWRIDNNATGLGDPAPEFKGEPARKPRNRPRPKTEAVHKSERWLTNRIAFEMGQGNLEQVEQWEAKLDTLVKSRTQRWYRWRVHFARENENPESVKFWQGFLNRKMGVDEF